MSQQGPAAELRMLGEALLQAWHTRSQAEQHSFARRIGAVVDWIATDPTDIGAPEARERPVPVENRPTYPRYPSLSLSSDESAPANSQPAQSVQMGWTDSDVVEKAGAFERLAAVSGSINPLQFKSGEPGPLAEIVLDRIAPSFDRTLTATGWAWTMRSERRAAILTALPKRELIEALDRASKIKTDPAGEAFRILLLNGSLAEVDAPLDAEVIAYTWLDLVEPERRRQTRSLRLQNAKSVILKALDHMLIEGFVGRAVDVDRLRAFAERPLRKGASQILSVTGIGGVGKSTLLAAALRPVIERSFEDKQASIVISIDFDRRSHSNGTELELSFELSRQLELFYPEVGGELEAVREAVTRDRIRRGELNREVFDSEGDSDERHGFEFQNRAAPILQRVGVGDRRLLLVVDTFEEWQRSQFGRWDAEHPIRRFLSWLAEVRASWGIQADVIISGRTPVSPDSNFASGGVIQLKDLNRTESVALLRQHGLTKREAHALARAAGGNPLALKLAARYYDRLPLSGRSAFLREGARELEGLDGALRQGVLYRRFLDHIADPKARKLAHPGLALRRVTPDLIREVLAEPCDLGRLSKAEAEDLLERLAREVWLVEGRWPVITHRPDLRRVMLRSMKSDPLQHAKIHSVHLAALQWHEQRADPSEEDQAEALYHRLSIADWTGQDIDFNSISPRLLQRVAQSADDFDVALRARLLFHVGRPINAAEAATLPARARQAWAQDRAAGLVRSGLPERALTLWKELGEGARPESWYSAAAFQAFDWPEVELLFEMNSVSRKESLRYDFLLSFVLQAREPDTASRYRHWLRKALAWQLEHAEENDISPIALEALYFESVIDRPAAMDHQRRMQAVSLDYDINATAQQYMRIRKVFRDQMYLPNSRKMKVLLSSMFCPTMEFLERVFSNWQSNGFQYSRFDSFINEFQGELNRGLSSDQMLGPWAERFASAVMADLERGHDREDRASMILNEMRSDDPEWRVPIRTALVDVARVPWARERLVDAVFEVLGPATPSDLKPAILMETATRSSRKAWGRTVEFLDRANCLGRFMRNCRDIDDARLLEICDLYDHWDRLRRESWM